MEMIDLMIILLSLMLIIIAMEFVTYKQLKDKTTGEIKNLSYIDSLCIWFSKKDYL